MKLRIMNTALCRTAAFSTEEDIAEIWEDLKQKIRESSPTFYQSIKDITSEELPSVNKKVWFTIWKYFKRAKYRATPFGSFSAINLIAISEKEPQKININNRMLIHSFRDWSETEMFTDTITTLLNPSTQVYKNSSVYFVNGEIRYVRTRNGKFEIATVIAFPYLIKVLEVCTVYQTLSNLFMVMQTQFGMKNKDTTELIRQMLALQLLITGRFPNIIGQDYFTRIKSTKSTSDINYLISERTLISGELCTREFCDLPKLIDFFSKNLPQTPSNDLDNFKMAFRKKFEQREVTLADVIDPEIGLGYGNLELQLANDALNILRTTEAESALNIPYSAFHVFILNNLIRSKPIQLEEFNGDENTSTATLPNTLSVLLHFWNGIPVIENMGGSTASSLLGRFTMAGQKFEDCAKEIAAIEERANPEVLFFDIAYQAEKKIDNVNRRKKIYGQELPILTWSCATDPLDFNDIMVSVQGGKVVLRSKKHGKRIVPRLPSAYNYTRSDLAAYRFLCDVQSQDLKTALNFDPRNYFPNLERYPRVNFKKIIVSPALWLVPKEFTGTMKTTICTDKREDLLKWLKSEGIDFMFKAGHADSTLCFDPTSPSDLDAFLMYSRQQQDNFYIAEALIANDGYITDEKGKNYSAQFVVNYFHEECIYEALPNRQIDTGENFKHHKILLPGSEWLYYELYCYPARSNTFLLNQLKTFLKEIRPYIKKWFFIRYDHPAPHLRLRIHLNESSLAYLIHTKLRELIVPYLYSGQISDFSIRTYTREMERYGAERMDDVEKFFHIDSEYALSLITRARTTEQLQISTLYFIQNVFLENFNSITDQINFVKSMADHFANEINMSPAQFRELNQTFNQMKNEMEELPISFSATSTLHYKKILANACNGATREERKKLLGDLIHMHINRLFPSDQRLHETILYHYLLRHLMASRARLAHQEVCKS